MIEFLLAALVVALVLFVMAFSLVSLQRVCTAVLADSGRRDELALTSVRELSKLHTDTVLAALDTTKATVESIAAALRPVVIPDLGPEPTGGLADVMSGFEFPDLLPDWTDTLIPAEPDRAAVAFFGDGFDPGAELGLR